MLELRVCRARSDLEFQAVLPPWVCHASPVVSQYFWFYSFGNSAASRALCHEGSAFHNLLVSGLGKDIFLFHPGVPKYLIVVGTSPSAFPLGQAGVWLLVAIMSGKKLCDTSEMRLGKVLSWGSCSWRGGGVFLVEFQENWTAWNLHLRELDLSSAVWERVCLSYSSELLWELCGSWSSLCSLFSFCKMEQK